MMNKNSTMSEMLEKVDHVLLDAVRGITDVIKVHGQINLDFEDLRTVMREVGPAIMGTGVASGENRETGSTSPRDPCRTPEFGNRCRKRIQCPQDPPAPTHSLDRKSVV